MPIMRLLTRCRSRLDAALTARFGEGQDRERGEVVEKVIIVSAAAAIAIAAMAAIAVAVDLKVAGIQL